MLETLSSTDTSFPCASILLYSWPSQYRTAKIFAKNSGTESHPVLQAPVCRQSSDKILKSVHTVSFLALCGPVLRGSTVLLTRYYTPCSVPASRLLSAQPPGCRYHLADCVVDQFRGNSRRD